MSQPINRLDNNFCNGGLIRIYTDGLEADWVERIPTHQMVGRINSLRSEWLKNKYLTQGESLTRGYVYIFNF